MYYFRADGSAVTGAGHLMRCLTVAQELQKRIEHPEELCFLCAEQASAELLQSWNMPVKILGTDPADLEGELSALEGLIRGSGHVFLVDSYAVTDAYLQALHRFGRVYLLDDMQQHAFPVDGVINYNLFASREKYRELYGSSTGQYLGAAYVPVRQQFCEAAAQYILQDDVTDILITTGGGDKDNIAGEILRELCEHHVSGQLKVAPEHISDAVLEKMGKPGVDVYNRFVKAYKDMNEKIGKKQYLVPYLMSSHPGSSLKEAVELAEFLRDLGYMPEQVQDFYPTPSTISTCMYYTGVDPRNMQPIYVAVNPHEKAMQRALIQYRNPKNYDLVYEALVKAGRTDLIGFDKKCLIRPRQGEYQNHGERNMRHDGKKGRTDQKPAKKKTIRNVHNKKASGTNMNKSAKNRADHSNPQRSVRKKK